MYILWFSFHMVFIWCNAGAYTGPTSIFNAVAYFAVHHFADDTNIIYSDKSLKIQ